MKQILLLISFLTIFISIDAQPIILEHRPFTKKSSSQILNLNTESFIDRIKIALSDWEGSKSMSNDKIDVLDNKNGIIVYKGNLKLMDINPDAKKFGTSKIVDDYICANYTLKVKYLKDCVYFYVIVPNLFTIDKNYRYVNWVMPIDMIIPSYKYNTNNILLDRDISNSAKKVEETVNCLINFLVSRIENTDDFYKN